MFAQSNSCHGWVWNNVGTRELEREWTTRQREWNWTRETVRGRREVCAGMRKRHTKWEVMEHMFVSHTQNIIVFSWSCIQAEWCLFTNYCEHNDVVL